MILRSAILVGLAFACGASPSAFAQVAPAAQSAPVVADETDRVVITPSSCLLKYDNPQDMWTCIFVEQKVCSKKPETKLRACAVALWVPAGGSDKPEDMIFGRLTRAIGDTYKTARIELRERGRGESFSAAKLFYREFYIDGGCAKYVLKKIWGWDSLKAGESDIPEEFFDLGAVPTQGTDSGLFLPGMHTMCD